MKNSEYIIYVDKLFDTKFAIAATIRNNIMKKIKSNINIDLIIIHNDLFMKITPYEIDFLCIEFSKNVYKNYQYGDYNLMWFNFVPNIEHFNTNLDEEVFELGALKRFHYTWYNPLRPFLKKEYRESINKPILLDRQKFKVYPKHEDVLKVFNLTDANNIRVIILGDEPYPILDYATGIAFGVEKQPIPSSLRQIEKAIKLSYPEDSKELDFSLNYWLKQGVLLLSTALTIRDNEAGSHLHLWDKFITLIVTMMAAKNKEVSFCLIGKEAQRYTEQLKGVDNKVILVEHPVEAVKEKRDWDYNNMFKKVNENLEVKIKWLGN